MKEKPNNSDKSILRESELFYTAIVQSSDDAIYGKTLDGIIKSWNKGAEKMYGYSEQEMIGKSVSILIPPQNANEFPEFIDKIRRDKTITHYETKRLRKDGTIIDVSVSISPIKGESGKIIGAASIARDITLVKSGQMFRELLDAAPDSTIIVNEEGKIKLVNQQTLRVFGYSRDELIGQHVEILIPQEYKHNHVSHRNNFFKNLGVRPMGAGLELFALKKDGSKFPVEISLSPLQTDEGLLVSAAIRDISQTKLEKIKVDKLNNELALSNNEMESFSYSISHDLRAPLRAINGYAKIIDEDYSNVLDDEGKRLLNVIQENANRMGSLIDDLLAFSRLGRKEINKSFINMGQLTERLVSESNKTSSHQLKIKVLPLHPVLGDYTLINQVMTNLLSNAIKFSSKNPEPKIEIKSEADGKYIIISVKDNGAGFDMQYSDKLFGVFQRLHAQNEFEGTGVGLAIVNRIITKHGGKVWAEGEINKGAVFYFSLPEH